MKLEAHHGGTVLAMFEPGDVLHAESDAVVTMADGITVEGRMQGGIFQAAARWFLSNESFFFQVLKAHNAGDALLAPVTPGDVVVETLDQNTEWMLQKGAFLACGSDVDIKTTTQSSLMKGAFSGTGLFILHALTRGGRNTQLAFGAFGAVHRYELKPNERRVIDNGHLVAWTANMEYSVDFAVKHSIISSYTSGEGLMCYFKGPGVIYVSSRNEDSFRAWMRPNGSAAKNKQGPIGLCQSIFATVVSLIVMIVFIAIAIFVDNDDN
eukprot:TRINITY_DN12233_c0_g1_i1.p2 TRINITY_DN12233_c0_g1~~TRINITY_DN12233_c0_g1_i1.p2  ORF type:complete len:267 (+),score=44.09 TRINITY_DN12233_c0_g1_i1:2208-3008(+)